MGKRGPQPGSKKQKASGFSEHITTGFFIDKDQPFTFCEVVSDGKTWREIKG